jgi:phage-related protein/murein DD-endopeptidase MepM/ murein hydrolase activator NlpD
VAAAASLAVRVALEGVARARRDVSSFEQDLRRAERAARNADNGLGRTSSSVDQMGGSFRRVNVVVSEHSRTVRKADRDNRGLAASFKDLDKGIAGSNQSFTALRNAAGLVRFPAMVTGAGLAAQALSAAGAAAVALGSALAPLAGLAAAGGAALTAAAQGAGVFALAVLGVKDALKEQLDLSTKTAGSAVSNAQRQRSAAQAIAGAQEGVRDATRSLAKAQEDARAAQGDLSAARSEARRRLTDLRAAVETAANSEARAALRVRDAREALKRAYAGADPQLVARAHDEVAAAGRREQSATARLNEARQRYNELLRGPDPLDLADAQDRAADAARSEQRAVSDAARARERYNQVLTDPSASAQDRQDATLDLADAENAVGDAQRERTRSERDLVKLQSGATDQEKAAAALAVRDAEADVAEAQRDRVQAEKDLRAAQAGPTEREKREAVLDLREAETDLAEAMRTRARLSRELTEAERAGIAGSTEVVAARERIAEANERVADAERSVARAGTALRDAQLDAAAGSDQAAVAAGKLTQKFDELPPAAQAFVRELVALKPRFDELRATAAAGVFPGLTDGLRAAMQNFGPFRTVVAQTAQVLGGLARQAGELVGSRAFGQDIAEVGARNARIIDILGGATIRLFNAFRHITVAAGPLTTWLAKLAAGWAQQIEGAAAAGRESARLAGFFRETRAVVERLVSIAGSLGVAFWEIGKAAAPLGNEILAAIDKAAAGFARWTKSAEGQNALKQYFADVKPAIFEFGRLIRDATKAFFRLTADPNLQPLIEQLRTGLLPALTETISKTTAAFGPAFVGALTQITRLFGELAGGGPLVAYVTVIGALAGAMATLLETVPGLSTLVVTIIGLNSVLKALALTNAIVGFSSLAGVIGTVRTAMLAMNAAFLLNPFVLTIAGLVALGAALVVAYQKSETFRDIVTGAFKVVSDITTAMAATIARDFANIVKWITAAWQTIRDSTTSIWNTIRSFLASTWSWLRGAASDTWNAIRSVITGAMTSARDTLTGIWGAIRAIAAGAWQGVRDSAVMWWGLVQGAIVNPIRAARDTVSEVWTQIRSRASEAWEGLKNAAGDFATGMKDRITGAFKDAANLVIGFINKIIDAINILPGVPNIKKLAELAEGGVHGGRATQAFARGGAFARTGGLVSSPMTLMGEEAPRHPEYVIPTNPAYRRRAQGLIGQAAQAVGFAEGGVYSKDELAALWRRANGNLGNANLMAAIALAESNGNPNAYNPSGATGLWQILGNPFPGNARDPLTNARMAGAKLRTQGLGAWEAYTNGAYRKYLSGSGGMLGKIGDVIGAVGGVLGDLLSSGADFILDKLPGVGSLPDWIQGLGKHLLGGVTGWVKDKVAGLIGLGGGQDGGMSATGGRLQLPATFASTHQTAGLPGYPAIDVFAKPGTTVLSPIDGIVSRLAGQSPARGAYMGPGGPFGWSMYLQGGGRSYFLTHFGARSVREGQQVQRGQAIGLVGDYPGSVPDHIHEGVSGMAKGGIFSAPYVGSYATGGVVPQDGFAYVHQGETINARGNGALVHIDQMVVNDSFDEEVWARKLALRLDQSAY